MRNAVLATLSLVGLAALAAGVLAGGEPACEPVPVDCAPLCVEQQCGADPVCGVSCGRCRIGERCEEGRCVAAGCGDRCPKMVDVPAGPFMMGCNESVDGGCDFDEWPYHEVDVPAFAIDRLEVTLASYRACVADGACDPPGLISGCIWESEGSEQRPVNCVSWYEAIDYCAWAGKRLCAESEWEKAARGTDGRVWPWGNDLPTCALSNHGSCARAPEDVGAADRCRSPYGACDLSGNIDEWVADDYLSTYVGAPTDGSVWSPGRSARVLRGGGWSYDVDRVRAAARANYYPGGYWVSSGIRCCRSLD